MIYPTVTQLLACIEGNLIEKVKPEVSDSGAQSALATIGHMLRLAAERVRFEGQYLTDDILKLRTLLPELAEILGDPDVASKITEALNHSVAPPPNYLNLEELAAAAVILREAVHAALATALRQPGEHIEVRRKIRNYLSAETEAETKLFEPAFLGKGPRR